MTDDSAQGFEEIEATLKKAAQALRDAGVPFLLGGSLASWARGGPESTHDLDLMIKPQDAERALQALVGAGMRPEDPPEEWLYKAWDGDVLIDLIHHPKGIEVDDEVIARGDSLAVLSMEMRVMALEDVFVTKLMALSEHALRFEGVLQMARALREQVDWERVRSETASSPFARAFFTMAEGLGVVPVDRPAEADAGRPRVSVLTPLRSAGHGAG
jgi:predicted nucleotidyltransferase